MESDRYKRGWEKLKEIDGHAGERVIEALKDIAPDLARYTIEFPFGDVYSRGVLSLKEREIATVAALAALGNAQPQLKVAYPWSAQRRLHQAGNRRNHDPNGGVCRVSRRAEWSLRRERSLCGT